MYANLKTPIKDILQLLHPQLHKHIVRMLITNVLNSCRFFFRFGTSVKLLMSSIFMKIPGNLNNEYTNDKDMTHLKNEELLSEFMLISTIFKVKRTIRN